MSVSCSSLLWHIFSKCLSDSKKNCACKHDKIFFLAQCFMRDWRLTTSKWITSSCERARKTEQKMFLSCVPFCLRCFESLEKCWWQENKVIQVVGESRRSVRISAGLTGSAVVKNTCEHLSDIWPISLDKIVTIPVSWWHDKYSMSLSGKNPEDLRPKSFNHH